MSKELDEVWRTLHAPRVRISDWKDPDYSGIFAQRIDRLLTIRAAGTSGWAVAFAYYKKHPVEAIEDWITTYDPRKTSDGKAPYMPFVLFDKQREFVEWIDNLYRTKQEGIVEKSRDGGASWICLAYAWWLWTFHPGTMILFGSRKEDLVDQLDDPNSLFEKFRVILRMIPDEMRPIGYDERKHDNHMRFKNPENGSAIVGEAGNQVGRGGRASIAFIDEAAFLEKPKKVASAISETCPTVAWISTPNLPGDWFAQRRYSGKIPVFTLAWQDDPRKGAEWYASRVATLDPDVVAREIDLNYEGVGVNIICPANWVRSSVEYLKYLKKEGNAPAKHGGVGGLDVGGGGTGLSVFVPRWGPLVGKSKSWDDDDSINIAYHAQTEARNRKCDMLLYDSVGVGVGVTSALRRMTVVNKGVNVGMKPTRRRWADGKKSRDKFQNLKAELWWDLRDRLRCTHEHWTFITTEGAKGKAHKLEDMILLPEDDKELTSQISLPLYIPLETGKIQIESKRQLKARIGADSPDHAEGLIISLAPPPRAGGSDRSVGMI